MKLCEANIRVPCARLVLPSALLISLFLLSEELLVSVSAQRMDASNPVAAAPLSTERVVENLVAMNLERARALHSYQVTETLRMEYRGLPGNRSAEMVVDVKYRSPGTKEFTIRSATGSKLLIDRVFRKLLQTEQQALEAEAQKRIALNGENYDFSAAEDDAAVSSLVYVLRVNPITKNKLLYRGRIWVNASDFAVVRVEAEPAKNPSFWTKDVEIERLYTKVGDFWLPARTHSITAVRLGGRAELTIQYGNYVITGADPVGTLPVPESARSALSAGVQAPPAP